MNSIDESGRRLLHPDSAAQNRFSSFQTRGVNWSAAMLQNKAQPSLDYSEGLELECCRCMPWHHVTASRLLDRVSFLERSGCRSRQCQRALSRSTRRTVEKTSVEPSKKFFVLKSIISGYANHQRYKRTAYMKYHSSRTWPRNMVLIFPQKAIHDKKICFQVQEKSPCTTSNGRKR